MECILGTFGSGKSTALAALAIAAAARKAIVVCPTETHCAAFRRLVVDDREVVAVQSAPKVLHALRAGHLSLSQAFFVDDADYPLGFRWSMVDLLQQLHATGKRIVFTCRSELFLKTKLADLTNIAVIEQRTSAFRLARLPGHGQFVRNLFRPQQTAACKPFPALSQSLRLQPVRCAAQLKSTRRSVEFYESFKSAVMHCMQNIIVSGGGSAVVLCNDYRICTALTDVTEQMDDEITKGTNFVHVQKHSNAKAVADHIAVVTSIPNFFGLSRDHVILVLPDAHVSTADLIEGCTRHSKTLTVLFNASAPPAVFVRALPHVVPLLSPESRDIFINWHIPKPITAADAAVTKSTLTTTTISGLAHNLTEHAISGASIHSALDCLTKFIAQKTGKPYTMTVSSMNLVPPSHIPVNKDGPKNSRHILTEAVSIELGRLAEALVLHQLGCPLAETEPFRESCETLALAEELECLTGCGGRDGVWDGQHESEWRQMLVRMVTARQGGVPPALEAVFADGYFAHVRQQVQHVLMPHLKDNAELRINENVNLTFAGEGSGTSIEEYVGRPDLVGDDCILEIKHMTQGDLDSYAVVQAVLYTIAAGKQYCLVYNASSGELLRVDVSCVF